MDIGNGLLLAVILWIVGYLITISASNPNSTFVHVPIWMFWLLSNPKRKKIPPRVLHIGSVFFQTTAILIAFYSILIEPFLMVDSAVSGFLGHGACIFLGWIVAIWLHFKRPYRIEPN